MTIRWVHSYSYSRSYLSSLPGKLILLSTVSRHSQTGVNQCTQASTARLQGDVILPRDVTSRSYWERRRCEPRGGPAHPHDYESSESRQCASSTRLHCSAVGKRRPRVRGCGWGWGCDQDNEDSPERSNKSGTEWTEQWGSASTLHGASYQSPQISLLGSGKHSHVITLDLHYCFFFLNK